MVRTDTVLEEGAELRLLAARNEFESAQVVVDGGAAGLADVDVTMVGALSGPGGAAIGQEQVTVYRAGWYDVRGFVSDGDLGGAVGGFADPLVPRVDWFFGERRNAFPVDVAAGGRMIAWVDVLVPADAPAGRYGGMDLLVSAADGWSMRVPVRVEVLDVSLDSTPRLGGGFDANVNRVCRAHACSEAAVPGGGRALYDLYARAALDNRVPLARPSLATPASATAPSWSLHGLPLLQGTARTRLSGARVQQVTIHQWAPEDAGRWRAAAEAGGFVDQVRFHCDEIARSASAWSACRSGWQAADQAWKQAATGEGVHDLPLQVTTGIDELSWAQRNGFGDVVARVETVLPVVNRLHPKQPEMAFPGRIREYDAWLATSTSGGHTRRVGAYLSCMSMGCSPNGNDLSAFWSGWPSYGIDQPAGEARATGWALWSYGLAAEYHYEVFQRLHVAWEDQWHYDDSGNHGDGTFFYPGTVARIGGTRDIPIESIRLKRIRDGREDLQLLQAAEAVAGREQVLAIARDVVPSMYQASPDAGDYAHARERLAVLLDARVDAGAESGPEPPLPIDDVEPDIDHLDLPDRVEVHELFQASATASDDVALADDQPVWNFGDGSADQHGSPVAHAYGAAGSYTVWITAADRAGNLARAEHTIVVTEPPQSDDTPPGDGPPPGEEDPIDAGDPALGDADAPEPLREEEAHDGADAAPADRARGEAPGEEPAGEPSPEEQPDRDPLPLLAALPAPSAASGGMQHALGASPTHVEFAQVEVGATATRSVQLTNLGPSSLAIRSVHPAGAQAGSFQVTNNMCLFALLRAGETCALDVAFSPARVVGHQALLTVSDSHARTTSVSLDGAGIRIATRIVDHQGRLQRYRCREADAVVDRGVRWCHRLTIRARLVTQSTREPVTGQQLAFSRVSGGARVQVGAATTDQRGVAHITRRVAAPMPWRASLQAAEQRLRAVHRRTVTVHRQSAAFAQAPASTSAAR